MKSSSHDSNLDILRSIAVLAVLVSHALQVMARCPMGEGRAYGVDTFALGRIGVLLFFVHTSLVLMQSLERTKLGGWPLMRHFYIRRAFRIYPLSVCLVLLSLACAIPPNALNVAYRWQGIRWALANLLLVQNFAGVGTVSGPLWSLPYEVQMYLVLPLLFLLQKASGSSARLGWLCLNAALLSLLQPLFPYFPCFLAGIAAYGLMGRVRPRLPGWLWGPAVAGAVAWYVLEPYPDGMWRKDAPICMAVGLLIPLFHRSGGMVPKWAAQVAKYSYGIYLCHMPVLWLVYWKLTIPDWQRAIWMAAGTGFTSVVCYHAIEEPLIRVGTRLANRSAVRVQAPVNTASGYSSHKTVSAY